MLHYLSTENDSFLYILKNKEYVVGRKECDILISDDQSISRKHATLAIKGSNVILTDCGSKYGTFVNQGKIEPNSEVILQLNDVIRFGVLKSIYTYKMFNIIITTSTLKGDNKMKLSNVIQNLGVQIVPDWIPECTHITVEQITLTVKVLCALIKGIPLVTLKFWEDYNESVRKNQPPPDVARYTPPVSEAIIGKDVSLDFKQNRMSLFKDKIFVLHTEAEKSKIVDLIRLAGGEAISWQRNPLPIQEIDRFSPEYIIMQGTEPNMKKVPASLIDAMNHYNLKGKRTIPFQEIALAILNCSCEKDCNPNFDRKQTLLAIRTQQDDCASQMVLAQLTQSQASTSGNSVKSEIIANTMDMEHEINVEDDIKDFEAKLDIVDNPIKEDLTSIKRNKDSIEEMNPPKRIKTDNLLSPKENAQHQQQQKNLFEFKREPSTARKEEPIGRNLFAFKSDKRNQQPSSEKESCNLFTKKRKADLDTITENPLKKNGNCSESKTPTNNPFLNIFNSKNNLTIDQVDNCPEPLASSTGINLTTNAIQISSFDIATIDFSDMENNNGWISKNSNFVNESNMKDHLLLDSTEQVDRDLQKYIRSFNDTVVIREIPFSPRDSIIQVNKGLSVVHINTKNFKKFKKVQPLHIQSRIIPEASYERIVCNM